MSGLFDKRMSRALHRWLLGGAIVGMVAIALLILHADSTSPASDPISTSSTGIDGPLRLSQRAESVRRAPSPARVSPTLNSSPLSGVPLRLSGALVDRDEAAQSGALEGRVVSASTELGIAHAELTFAYVGVTTSVATDETGTFRFAPRTAGSYELAMVTANGFLPYAPEWGHSPITFEAREATRVRDVLVRLSPALDYVGIVVAPDGSPIQGALVRIVAGISFESALSPLDDTFTTDASGEFVFHAPDGTTLEAEHSLYAPARSTVGFGVQVSQRLVLKLGERANGVPERIHISGRVVDAEGNGVDRAVVQADPAVDRESASAQASLTDEEGHFALEVLEEQTYRLEAIHSELGRGALDAVRPRDGHVVIRLAGGAHILGSVFDAASGAPIPSFTVLVVQRIGTLEVNSIAMRSFLDAEGDFAIRAIPAGTYELFVQAYGYSASSAHVVMAPGSLDVRLTRGGSIRGRVIDRVSRTALEGARVTAETALGEGASAVAVHPTAVSNASGEFLLAGLSPGTLSVAAAAQGHHGRIISGLSILEGTETGPIAIELTPIEAEEEPRLEMAGIGAVITGEGDALIIREVISGGGAEGAGLRPGDAVLSVDGASVVELGFQGAIERIRGPEGTRVQLRIRRADESSDMDIVVERKIIRA